MFEKLQPLYIIVYNGARSSGKRGAVRFYCKYVLRKKYHNLLCTFMFLHLMCVFVVAGVWVMSAHTSIDGLPNSARPLNNRINNHTRRTAVGPNFLPTRGSSADETLYLSPPVCVPTPFYLVYARSFFFSKSVCTYTFPPDSDAIYYKNSFYFHFFPCLWAS